MSFLPADGATTRLHKLNHLVEYCAAFSKGCAESQLIREGLKLGNTAAKILEYLTVLGQLGLITRRAERYFVEEKNYREWAEAKGFRERTYQIRCKECGAEYNSINEKCPGCSIPTKNNLNEPAGYTHIAIESIPRNESELTTEPNTHIHTKKQAPRQERVKEGRKAEKRVVKLLSLFGEARLGAGRGGEPDVFFTSSRASYGVEVKSVEHQVKSGNRLKAASVPLSRGQWDSLCEFAGLNGLIPLMIVELRVRGSNKGPSYYVVPREMVDHCIAGSKGKNIRISVHDLPALSLQVYRMGVPIPGGCLL